MELDEFIELTLKQIGDGISKAQATEGGENINALAGTAEQLGGNLINLHRYGVYTRVDFDVSISAETSGKGGARLTVFGVGAEGGAERKVASANRVNFSIPLRLPDGDNKRMLEIKRKDEQAWANAERGGSWMGE